MQGTEIPPEMGKQYRCDAHDLVKAGCAINATDNFYNQVTGFDALYDSMIKCKKGVMWKASVASYRLNAIERTISLMESLNNGRYKPKSPMRFKITHPKPRDIASVAFCDRVYQRSLNDNVVYPTMTASFIYDNYACQKGKGTDFARNRLSGKLPKSKVDESYAAWRNHASKGNCFNCIRRMDAYYKSLW